MSTRTAAGPGSDEALGQFSLWARSLCRVWAAARDPVFVCDVRGRLDWANAALAALLGADLPLEPDLLLRRLGRVGKGSLLHLLDLALRDPQDDERVAMVELDAVHGPTVLRLAAARIEPLGLTPVRFFALARPLGVDAATAAAPGPAGEWRSAARAGELEAALARIRRELDQVGLGAASADRRAALPLDLPAQQRAVVERMLEGLSSAEIAAALELSPHTVKNHRKAAYQRLGVHSQAELFQRYRSHA
ncbi:MAG: response regulator transcription factor [Acidimicrobiales bacterium]